MPLMDSTSGDALKTIRNRASIWPDGRTGTDRFSGVVTPQLKSGFAISKEDRFFTMGSCFARNVERRLSELGFDVPLANVASFAGKASGYSPTVMNKYTVQSMANELRWAAAAPGHRANRDGLVADIGDLLIEDQDGKWFDPHFHGDPDTFDRIKDRRERFEAILRTFVDCNVFVFTLGLAEAWFDTRTNLYLNQMPPMSAIKREPDRFRFRQLSYDEILSELEEIQTILTAHVKRPFNVLVTVSPVPFKRSFSGDDALIANTYSKSVQRSAVEALKRAHENVDYFPSYEMVTLSDRELVWETDNIHPTNDTVDKVMNLVISTYTGGEVDTSTQVVAAGKTRMRPMDCLASGLGQYKAGEFEMAAVTFAGVLDLHSDSLRVPVVKTFSLRLVSALMATKQNAAALRRLNDAVATLDFADSERETVSGLYRKLGEAALADAFAHPANAQSLAEPATAS